MLGTVGRLYPVRKYGAQVSRASAEKTAKKRTSAAASGGRNTPVVTSARVHDKKKGSKGASSGGPGSSLASKGRSKPTTSQSVNLTVNPNSSVDQSKDYYHDGDFIPSSDQFHSFAGIKTVVAAQRQTDDQTSAQKTDRSAEKVVKE